MDLLMFDSITVDDIPASGGAAVAGYVGGTWPTFTPLVARFPHLPAVSIAVNASEDAQALDIERGNASPDQVAGWLDRMLAKYPHMTPILYTSASQVATVKQAAGERRHLIWSAHYGHGQHICSPTVCGYPAADATQFADSGPMGGHYDRTEMSPAFLAAIAHRPTAATPPPPAKAPTPVKHPAPRPPYLGPAAHTSQGSNKPIRRIVLHSTVSACVGGGARAVAAYFREQSSGGSAHYVVDPSEVVQVVHDDVIAWHAPPNQGSIGVEMCDMPNPSSLARWNDPEHRALFARTARLVAELCLAYDVPPYYRSSTALRLRRRGVTTHRQVSLAFAQSDHWDPGAWPRYKFMREVRRQIRQIKRTAPR